MGHLIYLTIIGILVIILGFFHAQSHLDESCIYLREYPQLMAESSGYFGVDNLYRIQSKIYIGG